MQGVGMQHSSLTKTEICRAWNPLIAQTSPKGLWSNVVERAEKK